MYYFGGVITVEVHFDHLDRAHLYVRRQERAATWNVSEFYKQSSIGATWKWTTTRTSMVLSSAEMPHTLVSYEEADPSPPMPGQCRLPPQNKGQCHYDHRRIRHSRRHPWPRRSAISIVRYTWIRQNSRGFPAPHKTNDFRWRFY